MQHLTASGLPKYLRLLLSMECARYVRYRRPHYSEVKYVLYFSSFSSSSLLLPKIEDAIAHSKLLLVRGKSQKVKCMIRTVRLIPSSSPKSPVLPHLHPKNPPFPSFPTPKNPKKVKIPQPISHSYLKVRVPKGWVRNESKHGTHTQIKIRISLSLSLSEKVR